MRFENKLPQLPQGVVFNKKVVVLVGGGVVLFIVVFISLLQFSAPKHAMREEVIPVIDNQGAIEMIRRLQQEKLQATKPQQDTVLQEEETLQQTVPVHLTRLDREAAISIYQHVTHQSTKEDEAIGSFSKIELPATDLTMPDLLPNEYKQQNQQGEKQTFLVNQEQTNSSVLANYSQQSYVCSISAGSVIPATLQVAINSDLPGAIIGKVRQSVFDSVTGEHLLIPQGSSLIGQYDAEVAYGQDRVLIAWQRLIFPNGDSFQLEGQPGVDNLGTAGLKDKVNNHRLRLFAGSLMYSVLSVASSLQSQHHETDNHDFKSALSDSAAQSMTQTGLSMLNKNLNIQPTLTARVGMKFNVLLRQDLAFPSSYCG